MKIKSANHYFEIGSSHDDCQDFALSGMLDPNVAFAILSDGCSASHDICREVDFGARLMCYSAKSVLKESFCDSMGLITDQWSQDVVANVGIKIANFACGIGQQFAIHELATDATLLICLSDGAKHNILLYGDGGFVYKRSGDKTLSYTNVNFGSGAPFYLSYQLNEKRGDMYANQFGGQLTIMDTLGISEAGVTKKDFQLRNDFDKTFYHQTSFHFEGDMDFIALTSDGVRSFQKTSPDAPEIVKNIDAEAIVPEMFGFKNYQGQFVERRMNYFKKYMKANGLTHYDDISVSAIAFAP